jgi:hypothetical protein
MFYACVDTLAIVMFLGSYFWLRHFEQALDKSYRRHQITAADYTLMIKNIPGDITEPEVRSDSHSDTEKGHMLMLH